MENYVFIPTGTCSSRIQIAVENGIIKKVQFTNGCRGNTQGVARLAENRPLDEVIPLIKGIQCRGGTSCPDQLSKALERIRDGALPPV